MADSWLRFAIARRQAPAGFLPLAGLAFDLVGRLLAAAMAAMVSACAVGPDFVTPTAPVAPTWLEWRYKSLKTGDYEYRYWWRVFRDPALDRLIEIAYQ
ncbi:MAG TPA: hypothetical protein VNY06_07965 [Methylocella sp.]|nr:hypothetical protein [Methylocella sp.]